MSVLKKFSKTLDMILMHSMLVCSVSMRCILSQTRLKAIELRISAEEIHIVTDDNTSDIPANVGNFLF